MKLSEIRGKDTKELRLDLADLRKEYFQLSYKGGAEAVAKPHRFRQIRQTIARIHTVLCERDRGAAVGAAPVAAAKPSPAPAKPAKKAADPVTASPAKGRATKPKTSSK